MTHENKVSMSDIEARAKQLATAREKLSELAAELQAGIDALTRNAMKDLKRAVNAAQEHQAALLNLVERAPDLFTRPKSVVFHGVKIGYQKLKGKIEFDDAEVVIRLIKKHFPKQADVLISTKETPAKEALSNLSAADLKRLGVHVTEAGEVVFVKFTDTAVDKMVDALFSNAAAEAAS